MGETGFKNISNVEHIQVQVATPARTTAKMLGFGERRLSGRSGKV
jgi:hypothetical protein